MVVVAVREEPPLKLSGKCKELGRLCEICEGKSIFVVIVAVAALLRVDIQKLFKKMGYAFYRSIAQRYACI